MDEAARSGLSSTRRQFLVTSGAVIAASCAARPRTPPSGPAAMAPTASRIGQIESSLGGRIGVFAFQPGHEADLSHRADERFAMCSSFKWVLAAAVLAAADRGSLALDQRVPITPSDLLGNSPVSRRRAGEGASTVVELAEAAVTVSDNTAANLLLRLIGGPPGLTQFFRALGDPVSRLDRDEPALNTNLPNDPQDTTSPRTNFVTAHLRLHISTV